jgi:hypothetical protein
MQRCLRQQYGTERSKRWADVTEAERSRRSRFVLREIDMAKRRTMFRRAPGAVCREFVCAVSNLNRAVQDRRWSETFRP